MGKQVFLNAVLSIDSNDLSDWNSSVTLDHNYESKETTTYGSGGAQEYIGGLESFTLDVVFRQDYAAAALDSIIWPLHTGRAAKTFTLRANEAVVSSSNPQWSGSVLINSWKPIGGNVGDTAEVSVSLQGSGTLTRSTST